MPLSISSSNTAGPDAAHPRRWRWTTAWVLALVVAALIVGAAETHWRALGYVPNIRDSSELWSIQRDRVYSTKKTPLVLLGASRIEFAIDTKRLTELLPRYQPLMLAQNAHYPLAALRDLANDERFHGVVLCDLEERNYDEAARLMGCPVGTIRSRLHRARALLAGKLKRLSRAGTLELVTR